MPLLYALLLLIMRPLLSSAGLGQRRVKEGMGMVVEVEVGMSLLLFDPLRCANKSAAAFNLYVPLPPPLPHHVYVCVCV